MPFKRPTTYVRTTMSASTLSMKPMTLRIMQEDTRVKPETLRINLEILRKVPGMKPETLRMNLEIL